MDNKMQELVRKWLHIVLGCLVTAAGLIILKHSHIVTGGTAGLSLTLSYLIHAHFYLVFILFNIPFVIFSYFKLGRSFTFRTIIAISLLSALSSVDSLLSSFSVPSIAGAIAGGALVGVGICSLFRNGASLGGSTILALYLQKKYRLDPGRTNFVFDFIVVLTSFTAVSFSKVMISILSIAVTSGIISYYKNKIKAAQNPTPNNLSTAAAAE